MHSLLKGISFRYAQFSHLVTLLIIPNSKPTRQITALDATQVHVGPEELPQLIIDGKGGRFAQATEEQHLSLSAIQSSPLDLSGALLQVGKVHVPVGDRAGTA